MSDNFRVFVAALFGVGSPTVNGFFERAEPILHIILTLGQIGVAVVTILYIVRKWKNAREQKQK